MAPLAAVVALVITCPMAVVAFVSPAGTARLSAGVRPRNACCENVRRNNVLSIDHELGKGNMHMMSTDQRDTRDGAPQADRASFLRQQGANTVSCSLQELRCRDILRVYCFDGIPQP